MKYLDFVPVVVFFEANKRKVPTLRRVQVIKAENRFVWIDVGYNTATRVAKKELSFSQLVASRGDGRQRKGPTDFRIGDVLTFTIEDLQTPFGDMLLTASTHVILPACWSLAWLLCLLGPRLLAPAQLKALGNYSCFKSLCACQLTCSHTAALFRYCGPAQVTLANCQPGPFQSHA